MKRAFHTGVLLARAVAQVRETAGDATGAVAVITPSAVNGTLARQALGASAPFIRVSFITPTQLHRSLAGPGLRARGSRSAPPGWLRATIGHLLQVFDMGPYGDVLQNPGWLPALTGAIETMELAGLTADALRQMKLPGDLGERARVVSILLEGLDWARGEEGIHGPAAESVAALDAIEGNLEVPANEPVGAVLLGDARNPRGVFETLRAWLARRAVVRLGGAALDALPLARGGVREACPDAPVVVAAPAEPLVRMVRTPDPVREQTEIVRRVLRGVRDGLPFDRIAVVLPDPSDAVALREALERATIPATWMTGPPLASTPAARLLLHALMIASGEDSVASWYELLMRPGLRLRKELGVDAAKGRGRWRRLLGSCGAYRGTKTIQRALSALLDEFDDSEENEADRAAVSSLQSCVDHFAGVFATWTEPRTVGAWARTWLSFVTRHWRRGSDTRALRRLLETWSRADAGPELSLADARLTLQDALDGTAVTVGSLRAPSIRVLSPMQCLGADLDLVCVASMSQGRFPVNPSEDPILSDALIDAIHEHVDAGLFRSTDRIGLERRRFAAVRSAARGELWVSSPRVDMMKGRPLLPGSLLLELAEEQHGRRMGFAELEATFEIAGRRSRPFPPDPDDAIDGAELLLARLMEGDADTRDAALRALVDHPTAARLLRGHRAADLLRAGMRHADLRPHAGFVSSDILPCSGLDGAALSPRNLDMLLADPATFMVRHMLRAWPAKRLREEFDPVREWYVKKVLGDHARLLLHESTAKLAKELLPSFEATIEGDHERAGMLDESTTARVQRLGRRLADLLVRAEPNAGPPLDLECAPVTTEAPWRLEGGDSRRVGASLEWLVETAPGPKDQSRGFGHLAEVAAAIERGDSVDDVRWVGVDGSDRGPKDLAELLDGFHERLEIVTEMVSQGAFPGTGPASLWIDAAAESTVDEEWWASWEAT